MSELATTIVFGAIVLIWIFIALWLLLVLMPTLVHKYRRNHSLQTWGGLALTFDDGPHPVWTPKLLDLLAAEQVSATFFVLAEQAVQHPELIHRMQTEGHLVGLHGMRHQNPLLYLPSMAKKDIAAGLEALRSVGVKPCLYRPPHGNVTAGMLRALKKQQLQLLLWTALPGDWKLLEPAELERRLLKATRDGAVFCLHDGGAGPAAEENAPQSMIAALETAIPKMKELGYRFVLPQEGACHADEKTTTD